MERDSKRHKHEEDKDQDLNTVSMNINIEVQTILSIQELDDTLFSSFRHLPSRNSALIDFVEDTFDEIRRSLFNIEEIIDNEFTEAENHKQPFIHFLDDPDYHTIGEIEDDKTPTYTWDWATNKMVEKKKM